MRFRPKSSAGKPPPFGKNLPAKERDFSGELLTRTHNPEELGGRDSLGIPHQEPGRHRTGTGYRGSLTRKAREEEQPKKYNSSSTGRVPQRKPSPEGEPPKG